MQSGGGGTERSSGPYSPPDRLRLRIVEMAEKRSRGGSGRAYVPGGDNTRGASGRMPTTEGGNTTRSTKVSPLSGQLGEARHALRNFAEADGVEGEVDCGTGETPTGSRVWHRRDKINLDLLKTTQYVRQSSGHRAVQEGAVFTSPKERASAWLLRRFKQRRLWTEDFKGENCDYVETYTEEKVPARLPTMSAEPTKRYCMASGTKVVTKCTSNTPSSGMKNETNSKSPEEAETMSITPTSHFPSNGSAKTRENRQHDATEIRVRRRRIIRGTTVDKNDYTNETNTSRDKQPQPPGGYELKGSALATPPPRQSSNRKPGLFSASLEAFRRRLRITANKYSERLNSDGADRTEEYVIRPDLHNSTTSGLIPRPPQNTREGQPTPRLQARPPAQPRPLSEARRLDPRLKHLYLENSRNRGGKDSSTAGGGDKDISYRVYNISSPESDNNNNNNTKNNNNNNNNDNNNNNGHTKGENTRNHFRNMVTKNSLEMNSSSPNDAHPFFSKAASATNNPLPAPRDAHGELDNSSQLPYVINNKQLLPSVKTYVVMNNSTTNNNSNNAAGNHSQGLTSAATANHVQDPCKQGIQPTPPPSKMAPLTEHNVRLHESLQAMMERRARRMARLQKRQVQEAARLQQQEEQEKQEAQQQQQQQQQQSQRKSTQQQNTHHNAKRHDCDQVLQQQQHIQQQQQQPNDSSNDDSDDSEESPRSSRIRRWVIDVTEQSTLQPVPTAVSSGTGSLGLGYMTTLSPPLESAMRFDQALSRQSIACH